MNEWVRDVAAPSPPSFLALFNHCGWGKDTYKSRVVNGQSDLYLNSRRITIYRYLSI